MREWREGREVMDGAGEDESEMWLRLAELGGELYSPDPDVGESCSASGSSARPSRIARIDAGGRGISSDAPACPILYRASHSENDSWSSPSPFPPLSSSSRSSSELFAERETTGPPALKVMDARPRVLRSSTLELRTSFGFGELGRGRRMGRGEGGAEGELLMGFPERFGRSAAARREREEERGRGEERVRVRPGHRVMLRGV